MKNIYGIAGLVAIAGLCASIAAARPAYQESKSSSKSMISVQSNDGTDTYDIRMTDGKVVAKRNGEVIPEDRIRKTMNGDEVTIEILDEDGNVLKSFDLNKATTPKVHMRAMPGQPGKTWSTAAPKASKGGFRAMEPIEGVAFASPDIMDNPPPVMVGVTMSEPEASVLEFLKLEKGVVFDRVIEGLPAAKAGVLVGDILVEAKGEKNIDQERFREILRSTKAGDALEIKVARAGGEIQTLKLSLVAFDAKAIGQMKVAGEDFDKSPIEVYSHGGSHKNWDDAHKALNEAMANLKSAKLDEKVQKSIKESLSKAMESLAEAKDSMRDVQIFSNNGQWSQRSPKLRMAPNGENRLMVVPGAPIPPMPGMDDERINKLEQKVDDLNRKLDSIMELLKDRK